MPPKSPEVRARKVDSGARFREGGPRNSGGSLTIADPGLGVGGLDVTAAKIGGKAASSHKFTRRLI